MSTACLNERRTWTVNAYRNAETRQHSDANELTQRVLPGPIYLDLTYDAAGNLRTREIGDGSVEITYVWDAWNRLVRADYDSDVRAEYEYNGLACARENRQRRWRERQSPQ